jgi:hypothetical protein
MNRPAFVVCRSHVFTIFDVGALHESPAVYGTLLDLALFDFIWDIDKQLLRVSRLTRGKINSVGRREHFGSSKKEQR